MLPENKKLLELNIKTKKFLENFPGTVFAYIPDYSDKKPIIHSEILDLSRQAEGYGIYFTVNGFSEGKRTGENLSSINAFFTDIDYPDKLNRTPENVNAYKNDLLMELYDSGMIPTYVVATKNGLHVYWNLVAPIFLNQLNPDQQNRLRIAYRDIEESILKRFDGDPGAKDVARVLRVPGTLHQKDPNDPFECKLVHFAPENTYKFSEIQEFFMKKEAPIGWAQANSENPINEEVKEGIQKEYPKLERPSYKKIFSKEAGSIPEGMRNKALLVAAHAAKEAGWSLDQTYNHFLEFHGLGLREIRKTIKSAFEHSYDFGYNNEVMNAIVEGEERKKLSEVTSKVLSKATKEKRDTSNNAQKEKFAMYEYIIAERYPNLKYKARGDFYDYANGVYKSMQAGDVQSILLNEMIKDGLTNYRKVSACNDKIACFKSIPGRTFTSAEENPNPNVLNFKNGLLDISTYTLTAHTPDYLSTSQIPIEYKQGEKSLRWFKFVNDIMEGDQEQVKLLQQIAGYCLTNDTRYAKAFILFGSGANGKSLFTRIISKIIGRENVSSLSLTTITKQFGLTGLINKKLNIIDEISGNYFESNTIKGLISGEQMAAEVKFRPEPLEFTPMVKLLFSVNELPKINDTTPGLYRRFIIVPFNRTFVKNPNLNLEEELTDELPGILNWMIEGLKMLKEQKRFNETEKNFGMMASFKMDNSPLAEFLNLNYEPAPEGQEERYAVYASEIYAQYRNYCLNHGYKPKSLSNFSREMLHTMIDNWKIKKLDGRSMQYSGLRPVSNEREEKIIYPNAHDY